MFTPSDQTRFHVTASIQEPITPLCSRPQPALEVHHLPQLQHYRPLAGSCIWHVNQTQYLPLFARKATTGSFVLYYEGHPSTTISHAASAATVKAALSAIPAIRGVNVDFSVPSSGACNSAAINIIQVSHALSPRLFVAVYSTDGRYGHCNR